MSKSLRFLLMVAACVAVVLLFALFSKSGPLDNFDGCPISGASHNSEKMADNRLKNRYESPKPEDLDPSVTLERFLASATPRDFDESKAAEVEAYVRDVKMGGVESCNCRATDPVDRDTHIELLPKAGDGLKQVVISEVTPRIREISKQQGQDWSTEALQRRLVGHRVRIRGWIYYDPDHIEQAFANDPEDTLDGPNWRGTCWEIHPITSIEVLD